MPNSTNRELGTRTKRLKSTFLQFNNKLYMQSNPICEGTTLKSCWRRKHSAIATWVKENEHSSTIRSKRIRRFHSQLTSRQRKNETHDTQAAQMLGTWNGNKLWSWRWKAIISPNKDNMAVTSLQCWINQMKKNETEIHGKIKNSHFCCIHTFFFSKSINGSAWNQLNQIKTNKNHGGKQISLAWDVSREKEGNCLPLT